MRPFPCALGIITLTLAWAGLLLHRSAQHAFYAHMTVHMSVVAIAAPLLAFGIAGGRWDPVRRAPRLFSPLLASVMELAVVWLWHMPALHAAARHNGGALVAEQATFLLSGFLLWMSVVGGDCRVRASRSGAGIVALLLTAMHMTLLGALLALSPRPLYVQLHGALDLPPLEDQHLGGAIMLIVGGISYAAGGLILAERLLRNRGTSVVT